MAKWLDTKQWQIWSTLTFSDEVYGNTAWRRVYKWLNKMKNDQKAWDLSAFIGMEITRWRAVPHFHLLINSSQKEIRRDVEWKKWYDKHGRAKLEPFDIDKSAGYYITKYISKGDKIREFTYDVYGIPQDFTLGIFEGLDKTPTI